MDSTWVAKIEKIQNQLITRNQNRRIIRLLPLISVFYLCVYILAQYPIVCGLDIVMLLGLISFIAVMMFIISPYLMEDKPCH